MAGKHKFKVGQRVRPSKEGIDSLVFPGTYRGQKRSEWSGTVTRVDEFNCPTVRWDGLKRALGYAPDFIAPDRRWKSKSAQV